MINILKSYTPYKLFLISVICALFVIYPEITWLPWELGRLEEDQKVSHIVFFTFRCVFYTILIFVLIKSNLQHVKKILFKDRLGKNAVVCFVAYVIFGIIYYLVYSKLSHFGSLMLFQFFIVCILCTLTGHIISLYKEQRDREKEIESLKVENLQSQYDALTNQINPHFFFNSLNGLAALVRKRDDTITLTYINKLSDVFRYILQSNKKGLVTLSEELEFIDAFRYMMEIRFANKLEYSIEVDQKFLSCKIPVLSILPLLDNIVVHNMIDSDHKMIISIYQNSEGQLVISNPIYPKLSSPITNGTGLKNLENRFSLLMNKQIRVENDGITFRVYLPLI